ncbi:MAG: SUMF1/EgtB/PvdO family nonheme iron enzyme [Alphaproteobacteria bacterium]|nr:SUMF1/EgtB/PvdO family nonheme iron enzyme [Alphaproteobacteria bacterium]
MTPRLAANQGCGPDELSGLQLTDATRAFLVGRVGRMPVVRDRERVRIPRGNFVAGGTVSADERMLRIVHVAEPFWIARTPVTGRQWASWLADHPDTRQDAGYLPHWGPERRLPAGDDDKPVYALWPEDADRHAASVGARLPSADEWEKAARGIDGRTWPWGDHWRPGMAVTAELGLRAPLGVRAFGAHGDAALFGAAGGVFEYTASAWRDRPERGRVVMGGCYTHPSGTARPSLRLSHKLSGRLKAGLRLCWNAP